MSHAHIARTEVIEVTTLGAKEVPAFLKQREENITFYAEQLQTSDAVSDGWRFLIGCEILVAKRKLEHGEFMPWVKGQYERLGDRTVQRFHQFAELALPKFAKLANLKELPEKIEKGEPLDNERELIFESVKKLTEGRGITHFIKEHTPKPERKIKFHCPECGQENEGIMGRHITCVNGECKEKIKVAEDAPTPEEQVKEKIKQATDFARAAISALRTFTDHKQRGDIDAALLREFRDTCVESSKAAAKLLKKRRGK